MTALLSVAAALVVTSAAVAHRGHGIWTEMTWVGERFEVTHRMHTADAIAVLRSASPDVAIDSIEGRARLALYLADHFRIVDAEGRLVTLGAELEDDFLLVFQEWYTAKPAARPQITNTGLLEIDAGAQHFVRYDDGEDVETWQILRPD